MLQIHQRVLVCNIERVVIDIMQEHIDAAKVIGLEIPSTHTSEQIVSNRLYCTMKF